MSTVTFEDLVDTLFPDATGSLRLVGANVEAASWFTRIGGVWTGLGHRQRGERPQTFEMVVASWGGFDVKFGLVLARAPSVGALLPPRHV